MNNLLLNSLHILAIQTSSSLDEDLAPKNELCDEFLFTSHVMDAGPNMAVVDLMFLEWILNEDLCQSFSALGIATTLFLKGGYSGRRLACHIL